jgi:hypothetical protein
MKHPKAFREAIEKFEGTKAARLKPVSGRADALPSSSHSCETKMRPVYPLDRCRNIFSCELVSDSASARIFQPFNVGDVVPGLALRTRHSGKVLLRCSFSECASDLCVSSEHLLLLFLLSLYFKVFFLLLIIHAFMFTLFVGNEEVSSNIYHYGCVKQHSTAIFTGTSIR